MEVSGNVQLGPSKTEGDQMNIEFKKAELTRIFIDPKRGEHAWSFYACQESHVKIPLRLFMTAVGQGKPWSDFFDGSYIRDLCVVRNSDKCKYGLSSAIHT